MVAFQKGHGWEMSSSQGTIRTFFSLWDVLLHLLSPLSTSIISFFSSFPPSHDDSGCCHANYTLIFNPQYVLYKNRHVIIPSATRAISNRRKAKSFRQCLGLRGQSRPFLGRKKKQSLALIPFICLTSDSRSSSSILSEKKKHIFEFDIGWSPPE